MALLRVAARRHHPSDVVVGALIGIASGFLVPLFAGYGGARGIRR